MIFLCKNDKINTDFAEISVDKDSTLTYPVYLFNSYMQIQKQSFEKAIMTALGAVSSKTAIPALEGLLLTTTDQTLEHPSHTPKMVTPSHLQE